MAILPDDIRELKDSTDAEKIQIIYDYILYMKENMEFWGSNQNKRIIALEERENN